MSLLNFYNIAIPFCINIYFALSKQNMHTLYYDNDPTSQFFPELTMCFFCTPSMQRRIYAPYKIDILLSPISILCQVVNLRPQHIQINNINFWRRCWC